MGNRRRRAQDGMPGIEICQHLDPRSLVDVQDTDASLITGGPGRKRATPYSRKDGQSAAGSQGPGELTCKGRLVIMEVLLPLRYHTGVATRFRRASKVATLGSSGGHWGEGGVLERVRLRDYSSSTTSVSRRAGC